MRKVILAVVFVVAGAASAFTADLDRHANYTDPSAADKGATVLCQGFYDKDDNRTPCQDWCQKWLEGHESGSCECTEGKCAADAGQH